MNHSRGLVDYNYNLMLVEFQHVIIICNYFQNHRNPIYFLIQLHFPCTEIESGTIYLLVSYTQLG